MEADVELDAWRRHWQSDSRVAPTLKQRVERETRAMRRFVVGEIVVTIVFGGGSLAWAALSLRTDVFVLALGVWAFIAIAWTISFLLRRGAWAPLTSTTMAFVELSILRCRRRRESIIAQAALYVMILGFDLAWIYATRPAGSRRSGDRAASEARSRARDPDESAPANRRRRHGAPASPTQGEAGSPTQG